MVRPGRTWGRELATEMAAEMGESKATALEALSAEHLRLREAIDGMLTTLEGPEAKSEAEGVLSFIADHIFTHFTEEEATMRAHAYPRTRAHKSEHAQLAEYVTNLERELQETGRDQDLLLVSNRLLCNWLLTHFGTSDKHFETFLRNGD